MLSVTFSLIGSNVALRLPPMIPSTSVIEPSAAKALRNLTAKKIHMQLDVGNSWRK